jgi:cyclopropane fatty-acyl-phospholipid synthase-like methyltransferase
MDNPPGGPETALEDGSASTAQRYEKDFWSEANKKFTQAHFRLEKAARMANTIAAGKECDLLDIGCGPGTLGRLLDQNIRYYGIDIAIHDPAPNMIEADLVKKPVAFGKRSFGIVVAQGVFEYMGSVQSEKFAEINRLLTRDGTFIVSYWNFGHRDKQVYEAFSNIQPLGEFRASLARHFTVDRSFPAGHNWHHREPGRKPVMAAQMRLNANIPFISPMLAVEYFFICSPRR